MEPWAIWNILFYVQNGKAWLRREVSIWSVDTTGRLLSLWGKYHQTEEVQASNGWEIIDNYVEFARDNSFAPLVVDGVNNRFIELAAGVIADNVSTANPPVFPDSWRNALTQRMSGVLKLHATINDHNVVYRSESTKATVAKYSLTAEPPSQLPPLP